MFLKSIEIRGFKSFADKTELVFKDGVTAIVGPNGSGKSNISDSVRWVLGEQSVKSLRGGKMEDVIFAGTQFRKPVGLCQVSLTMDNQDRKLPLDYSDVTISRRLYRSGESEYYINNTQCRLKDIQQLFMDTGIGKEGYSIIGQGKIDAVLSGRPEERRGLLEEAAGIVKFKWRKEEASKKLDNTEANLVRIDDILHTYEERLEPLRIENEKAKEFLKLSHELKHKEINVIVHSIEKVQQKINEVFNTIKSMDENKEELNQNFENVKEKIHKCSESIENLNESLSQCNKEYYKCKEKKQNTESESFLLRERLENLNKFIEKNSLELGSITNKIASFSTMEEDENKELSALKDNQKEINGKIYFFGQDIEQLEASMEKETNLVKKLKEDQIEYLSSISNLKNSMLILNNDIEAYKERIDNIKNSCESYMHSIKINSNTKEMLLGQTEEIKKNIEEFEANIKDNKREMSKISSILLEKEKQLKGLNNLHSKLEANHNMLVNLDKQYEGYNRAVKTLMRDINNEKAYVPKDSCYVLGEVISVDQKFEVAMEIALGGAISDVITSDENIAKNLIKYLKSNNLGRATFLPLTTVKGRKLNVNPCWGKISGYIGIASELINYDENFRNAIEYTLGRTVIAESMDSALNIAKVAGYSFKIVTLTGEVVNPGGSLTGGSLYHKGANIIGRKREIEETKFKINDTADKISSFSKNIDECRYSIRKLDEENLNLKDNVYSQNIEITKIKGKINAVDVESGKLHESIRVSNREIELIQEKLRESLEEQNVKDIELKSLSLSQKKNDDSIVDLEEKLKYNTVDIKSLKEQLTEFKIRKAQIDENVNNKVSMLEKLQLDLKELKDKEMSMKRENDISLKTINECKNKIEEDKEAVKLMEIHLKELEEEVKSSEIEVIKIKEKMKIDNETLESLNLLINKKDEEMHRLQLSMAKFSAEKENLYGKLNDELEITYAEALQYKKDIDNIETHKREITSLKTAISSLGVVNLGAIDEYRELTEKVNFMNTQREDLVKAKEELTSVINEMIEKMKSVFNENFNKLKKNFNETFRELFKGGNADLILTNGDELTGNIDITVQPPGKKLQNINLMSGGEKGLSAIALLFAILKMKPTPFCMLDEIEAALDDANVSRYAEFLKKFSENIQFIVITHRKGTMESSDALYGVTMEEKGISKVVSVDLKEEAS